MKYIHTGGNVLHVPNWVWSKMSLQEIQICFKFFLFIFIKDSAPIYFQNRINKDHPWDTCHNMQDLKKTNNTQK